jgi:hypothetical protein
MAHEVSHANERVRVNAFERDYAGYTAHVESVNET